jgi:hypothetical protein
VAPARGGGRERRRGVWKPAMEPPARRVGDEPADALIRQPYLVSVSWGILWRYGVLGLIVLADTAGVKPPSPLLLVVGAAGAVLGLWFRSWWIAALWRAAVVGWAATAATRLGLFPYVVAGGLTLLTVEPWVAARNRRSRRVAVQES